MLVICNACNAIILQKLAAQNRSVNFVSENIPKLKQTCTDLNQNVLAMLTLIK
jgi:hypothetical protein